MKRERSNSHTHWFHSGIVSLLVAVGAMGGCGKQEIPVVVTLTGAEIADGELTITPYLQDQQGKTLSVGPGQREVVLYLPAEARGELRLTAESRDPVGCALRSGEARIPVTASSMFAPLKLELPITTHATALCRVTLRMHGGGELVASTQASCRLGTDGSTECVGPVAQKLSCAVGGDCAMTLSVQRDTQLVLNAEVSDPQAAPIWTAECAEGSPGCPCEPGNPQCAIQISRPVGVAVEVKAKVCGTNRERSGFCFEQPLTGSVELAAVWGSRPDRVWAVGDAGTVRRLDGGRWLHIPSGTEVMLRGVFGLNDDDVWTVGDAGTVLHYQRERSRFMRVTSGTEHALNAIWGSRADNLYAVGKQGTVLHWNGKEWQPVRIDSARTTDLNAIWGSSDRDIWIVGDGQRIFHFDGTAWANLKVGDGSHALRSVWGFGADDLFVVGDGGTILHKRGSQWGAETAEVTQDFKAVYGHTSTGVFVVGQGRPAVTQVIACSGAAGCAWSQLSNKATPVDGLNGLWIGSDGRMWAVGPGNVVSERMGASQWHQVEANWAPYALPGGDIWFTAGPSGILGRWHDGRLAPVDTNTKHQFNHTWSDRPDNVWAVGSTVMHWDGVRWSEIPNGATGLLFGIWGSPSGVVWIGGREKTLQTCNLTGCKDAPGRTQFLDLVKAQGIDLGIQYLGVRGLNDNQVWVSIQGESKRFLWDGKLWQVETNPMYPPSFVRAPDDLWSFLRNSVTGKLELWHQEGNQPPKKCEVPEAYAPGWGMAFNTVWVSTSHVIWALDASAKGVLRAKWNPDCAAISWDAIPTGATSELYMIVGNDRGDILVGGSWGQLMRMRE